MQCGSPQLEEVRRSHCVPFSLTSSTCEKCTHAFWPRNRGSKYHTSKCSHEEMILNTVSYLSCVCVCVSDFFVVRRVVFDGGER